MTFACAALGTLAAARPAQVMAKNKQAAYMLLSVLSLPGKHRVLLMFQHQIIFRSSNLICLLLVSFY